MSAGGRAPAAGPATTWRTLWATTAQAVGDRTRARWMCEVAAGLDGDELRAALDEPATTRMVAHLDAMIARFVSGEPLQYVLGRWGFRRLDLAVDRRVLIPRPETELVAEVAIGLARRVAGPVRVADLGTGSGAIGLAMADELPLAGTIVWLTDVSADALDVARANLAGIGRAAVNVRVAEGSWFEALPAGERFDVIVANPPYVADGAADLSATVAEWEPHIALFAGADGLDEVRRLVAGAPPHLAPDGWLVLEIGADQGMTVRRLLVDNGYRDVEIRRDLAGRDRIALARTSRGAAPGSVPPDPA
jgi:release factor glutamine methyltransferase